MNLNKLAKRHIPINELGRIQKLNELSHETIKKPGELQRIKNYNALSKEDLINLSLRSKNPNEGNYILNIINRVDASDLDNEIKAMINYIRETVTRLGSIITNKERTKSTKELYETLKKKIILIEIQDLEKNKKNHC